MIKGPGLHSVKPTGKRNFGWTQGVLGYMMTVEVVVMGVVVSEVAVVLTMDDVELVEVVVVDVCEEIVVRTVLRTDVDELRRRISVVIVVMSVETKVVSATVLTCVSIDKAVVKTEMSVLTKMIVCGPKTSVPYVKMDEIELR